MVIYKPEQYKFKQIFSNLLIHNYQILISLNMKLIFINNLNEL